MWCRDKDEDTLKPRCSPGSDVSLDLTPLANDWRRFSRLSETTWEGWHQETEARLYRKATSANQKPTNQRRRAKKKLSRLHVNTENGVSEYLHIEAPSAVTWNVRVRVNGTWLLVKKVSHEEKKSLKVSKTLSDLFFISDLCRPSFLLIFFPSRLQISKQKIPCL